VRDYDQDGKDDVLTVPKAGAQDVRVWNNRSQKLGSWRIPGNDLRGFSI